jgi:hypothetical protein
MPRYTTLLIFTAALAGAALLSALGIKSFEAWEQVSDLWETGVSPLFLAAVGHPHFFRFLTAYPGFLLEQAYPGFGFSLYISVFLAFNVALLRRVALLGAGRMPGAAGWTLFLAAHFFMNGRGVIAWTAWLLCVLICLRLVRGEERAVRGMLQAALACWLAAVSTGVFIVVVAALVLFYMQYRRRRGAHIGRKLALFALCAPLMYYTGQYLWLAIKKNIDFFGGGLSGMIHMLAHGLGRVLFGSEVLAVCLVALAAFLLLFLYMLVRMRGRALAPLEQLLGVTVFGGMFGLTVLTLALPLLLLFRAPRAPAARHC